MVAEAAWSLCVPGVLRQGKRALVRKVGSEMPLERLCMEVVLIALVATGALLDVKSRRIPNSLNLTLLAVGLALCATPLRLVTPSQALLGAVVGLAVPMVLHVVGGLAAGDVKLLCGIGAWIGPRTVILVMAGAALAGLVLVLAQCIYEGRLGILFRNTGLMALSLLSVPRLGLSHVIETGQRCQSARRPLPYALTVLVGTIAVVLMQSGGALR